MRILILCSYGKNRSRFLANFLQERGYDDVDYDGVKNENPKAVQQKIDSADLVITVHPSVAEVLHEQFQLEGKRLIELDVEDRPEVLIPNSQPLDGQEWLDFQRERVYAKLAKEIEQFLPFEKD